MGAGRAIEGWASSARGMVFLLSIVLVFTSMVDLFVNRLMFRAGPEVLSHINVDANSLAILGRVSLTLEQLLLFAAVGVVSLLLFRSGRSSSSAVGATFVLVLTLSAMLYAPLPGGIDWVVSAMLIVVAGFSVVGLSYGRASASRGLPRRQRLASWVFLGLLSLGFIFPLYYRAYLLAAAAGIGSLPFGLGAYQAGIYSVIGATLAAFAYSLAVSSPGYKMGIRRFVIAAALPTLVVVPILYGLFESFFMTQIFAMVIAMSTDFALSLVMVQVLGIMWWVLLTASLILVLKGRGSANKPLIQQGIGLLLLMSTTFLFNYPYYILLGILGMVLITNPIRLPGESQTS